MTRLPYSAPFDLGTLSEHAAEVMLAPDAEERRGIAEWLGIVAVESLAAKIRISRSGSDVYSIAASFAADVVQACVVTLEPVRSHLTVEFSRRFRLMSRIPRRALAPRSHEIAGMDDDETEILKDAVVDLAAPVLEELSLALDPYPRAEGAVFGGPSEEKSAAASPFAVLESLKRDAQMAQGAPSRVATPAKGKASVKSDGKAKDKTGNGD